jgi:hypothetical protein
VSTTTTITGLGLAERAARATRGAGGARYEREQATRRTAEVRSEGGWGARQAGDMSEEGAAQADGVRGGRRPQQRAE